MVTQRWLKGEISLTLEGKTVSPVPANAPLTEEDHMHLRRVGASEAYEGIRAWAERLKVCHLSGSHVTILPAVLAEFSSGPPSVRDAIGKLQKSHEEEFMRLLEGKLGTPEAMASNTSHDPRPPLEEGSAEVPDAVTDLQSYDDEAALRAAVTVTCECKTFDSRSVTVLVSECGHVFLLSKDQVCPKKNYLFSH